MKTRTLTALAPLVVVAAAAVLPLLVTDRFLLKVFTFAGINVLVVIGLALLFGHAGQVSLGHAGFFAIGGYASAVLTTANLIEYAHAENNRIFLDPILKGTYPQLVLDRLGGEAPEIRDEDLKIANQVDFLGVQYYADKILHSKNIHWGIGSPRVPFFEYTEMGWPVTPLGLYEHLIMLKTEYEAKDIFITENGSAWQDVLDPDGRIRDEKRQKYLVDHLLQVHRAIEDGVPIKGYFAWSFMDNFEWAYGYRPRFGLVYTEYASQKRYIKDSGLLYHDIITANGLEIG